MHTVKLHTYITSNYGQFYCNASHLRPDSPSGVSIGRLSGVRVLWDCVPNVCGGGGGCAGGGVPLGAVPVLSW